MSGWERCEDTNACVICPACAFTFDASHENSDGSGYSCPLCALQRCEAALSSVSTSLRYTTVTQARDEEIRKYTDAQREELRAALARAEADAAVVREALHAHWAYEDHKASCALCISRREQQECKDALTLALSKHESRKVVLVTDAGKPLLAEVAALREVEQAARLFCAGRVCADHLTEDDIERQIMQKVENYRRTRVALAKLDAARGKETP